MLKIILIAIVSVLLSITINIVSNSFMPAITQRKKFIFSFLLGLIVLSILVTQISDSAGQSAISYINSNLLSSPWGWSYVAIFVVSLFFISNYFIKRLRIVFTIVQPTDIEKAYLESLIKDLELRNQQNRWSDKFYIDIDTELGEKIADYEIKSYFYLVKPFDKDHKQQEYDNLENIEKIDSSRGTTFRTLGKAIDRATDNAVVVLSPPGGGKTVSLRNLAIKLAKKRIHGEVHQLPIFINLGFYIGLDDKGNPQKFEDFIDDYFASSGYQSMLAKRHWEELLVKDHCIFFLDGLDEIPRNKNEYIARVRIIENFTRLWPNVKFIISCRELDYERDLSFQQVIVKPFNQKHILKFIKKYFKGAKVSTLITEIKVNKSIFELCENPFYLNLICNYVNFTKSLPQNKTQLFRLIIDRLIDRETLKLGIDEKEVFKTSFINSMAFLASTLAFRRRSTSITIDEYIIALEESEESYSYEILNFAIRGDIIEINESKVIRFTHNRFQEYFSSFDVIRKYRIPSFRFPKDFFVNIWWRETILFIAGLDSHPSDFVQLVLKAGNEYRHPKKAIERFIKFDILTLAFDCIFSSLNFDDVKLYSDVRDQLISHYQNANILEKAKILTSISQDQSESSIQLIEKALEDKSDWISERAFFILNEGTLRLQMKPIRILFEFWRFFLSGRIFLTMPAVLKASRRSKILRWFLPVYFALVFADLITFALVLFVFYELFNFLAFDLKYNLSLQCIECLFGTFYLTSVVVYILSRENLPFLNRFLFASPVSVLGLYTLFFPRPFVINLISGCIAFILLFMTLSSLQIYFKSIIFRLMGFAIICNAITSIIFRSLQGFSVPFQAIYTYHSLNTILDYSSYDMHIYRVTLLDKLDNVYTINILLILTLVTIAIAAIVYIFINQIIALRKYSRYKNEIEFALDISLEEEEQFTKLNEMFSGLKSLIWVQKLLLQEIINYNLLILKKSREECLLYLIQYVEYLESSPLRDAIFQKIENEEQSYRREI